MKPINRREFTSKSLLTACALWGASTFSRPGSVLAAKDPIPLQDRLFVMSPWFYNYKLTATQMAELLNLLKCPRVGYSLGEMNDERWKTFDQTLLEMDGGNCKIAAVYTGIDIDAPECPPHILRLCNSLKGRDTLVWVTLNSQKIERSNPAGDESAVKLLQQASDAAKEAGLTISIYPHMNNWVERTDDAFRVAQKTDRDNVGCTFNLYHWLKVEGPDDLPTKAQAVLPKLNGLTINGSMINAKDLKVEEGILPLGKGDYDVQEFLRTFLSLGYKGPIGLQGYGIQGDIPSILKRSLETWGTFCQALP